MNKMFYRNKNYKGKPIVVVVGFAGSKISAIKKYCSLWETNEFNVIGYTPSIDLTLMSNNKPMNTILDEVYEYFKDIQHDKRKLIFHGVSLGSGVVTSLLGKIMNIKKYKYLNDTISGIVIDSGPIVSVEVSFKGFKKTLSYSKKPHHILLKLLLPLFTPFWKYHVRFYKHLISNNNYNYLIIHNPLDEYLPGASSICINDIKNNNINHIHYKVESSLKNDELLFNHNNDLKQLYIIEQQFDSPHAKHLIYNTEKYKNIINQFILII